MNNIAKKALSLVFVLSGFCCLQAVVQKKVASKASINVIKNFTAYNVLLRYKSRVQTVCPEKGKSLEGNLFEIPYVSIKEYLNKYVKNEPFKPKNSLEVHANKNKFYIWENESGIVCAPDPGKLDNLDKWKTRSLFDTSRRDYRINMDSPIKFALLVDKLGALSLEAC